MTSTDRRYDDLTALFFNCTLKPSPELSHTQTTAPAGTPAAATTSRAPSTANIQNCTQSSILLLGERSRRCYAGVLGGEVLRTGRVLAS